MIRRTTALLALAAALVGCGPAAGAPASTPTPSATAGGIPAVYRELAQCIRTHGVPNFPDPVLNSRTGKVDIPPGTAKPSESVMRACQSIVDRIPASDKGRPATPAELDRLRRLARCMRDNGLRDWPDPDAQGDFPMPKRLRDLGKRAMRSQLEACRQYFPEKGISVKDPAGSGG
ncbi:hypothetical protein [Sphaerisporangium perillae]|uniref:hypothetical protein n=1 Tax=Sphaerisporangium perillae TaxID=2935860 RepID=UPI00200C7590|nr:hypothetical protein [Sphaerisporangium perillae]